MEEQIASEGSSKWIKSLRHSFHGKPAYDLRDAYRYIALQFLLRLIFGGGGGRRIIYCQSLSYALIGFWKMAHIFK